ncbi:hydroxyacid dehydrogenase [Antiquaquibacter soli]|uniref:Hydroxyacid dehydrogenase n=1 Tax=Antiquaquibacter soli TaxID=3064523 RepID=A0ABT9BP61_9MICO|nr:hydroxyacid dehydrogenase [Protaetiibacter sp. WY-16]MDO7882823.1 hydroxyacid dehydrogenase [Protaetiibacter sp. WY-16]
MAAGRRGRRPLAAFALHAGLVPALFDAAARSRLDERLDVVLDAPISSFDDVAPEVLAELEVLVTGWGAPTIGARELDAMPRLRAIFHAAGSVKGHLGAEVWERGVLVTTAAAANAHPVAEYTLAMILLAGKGVLPLVVQERDFDHDPGLVDHDPDIGNYRRTVGIIGASTIGRRVIGLLSAFDFDVLLYDPLIDDGDPVTLQSTRVGLDELLTRSSIVSIHAPLLPSTVGMIGRAELARMPDSAVLLNTARGPIVDSAALEAELRAGRLRAILDVTDPDPLEAGASLRSAPGLVLTPHVAGALGNEVLRLGESVLQEVERFVVGAPAAYPVLREHLSAMA